MAFTLSFAYLAGVIALAFWSPTLNPITRRPIRVVASFIAVGFAIRGLFVAITKPIPQYGNSLSDPVLDAVGYTPILTKVNAGVATGLLIMTAIYTYMMGRQQKSHPETTYQTSRLDVRPITVALIYLAGYLLRFYILATQGAHDNVAQGTTHSLFGKLGILCSIWVTWCLIQRVVRWVPGMRLCMLFLVIGEIAWAAIYHSKTPVIALVVGLYFSLGLKRPSFKAMSAGLLAILLTFAGVGQLRSSESDGYAPLANKPVASALVKPVYDIVARADGIQSAARVVTAGPGSYMDAAETARTLVGLVIPDSLSGLRSKVPGQQWTATYLNYNNETSLAEGIAAEGFAIGGFIGLISWSIIAGLLLGLMARATFYSRQIYFSLVGAGMLTSTAFVERGLLGILQNLVDIAEVSFLLLLLFALARYARQTSQSRTALKAVPT